MAETDRADAAPAAPALNSAAPDATRAASATLRGGGLHRALAGAYCHPPADGGDLVSMVVRYDRIAGKGDDGV